jgi:hypothetical protein
MRFLMPLAALASVVALAACSPGEEAQTSETEGAASSTSTLDPRSRETVYAVQSEGAEPFVRALYGRYVAGGPTGEPPPPGRDPLLSRTLNALVGVDARAANGEVPNLNYDPFCGCQDQGDFVLTALAVAQSDRNAADANVSFTNAGQAKDIRLKLVREGPNWKVDDIIDGDTSLHDTLMAVAERAG